MKTRSLTMLALTPLAALGTLTVLGTGPAGASSPTKVTAKETQWHIALSQKTFTPGRYAFVAENKGTITHALMITGPGVKGVMTSDISPGQSATLDVSLKKGTYDIDCPLPDHKAMGMNVDIVVGSGGKSSSASSATTPTTSSSSSSTATGGAGF